MFNLSGNYKQISVDVNCVDVVREREQERRARMQLLDDIREPSPQPIFGEPVKVDLEDETSRRIKNTLGDFTQVLINDPKNLIGISRSTNPGHPMNRHPSNGYPTSGHPVNGYSPAGHPTSGHIHPATTHPSACQQTGYSSNGYAISGHTASGNPAMGHTSVSYGRTPQAAFKKPPYVSNGASVPKPSMPNYISPKAPDKRQQNFNRSEKSIYSYKPESPVTAAFSKSYPKSIAPSLQHPVNRDWEAKDQRRTPVVENSSNASINVSSGTISTSAPIWNCGPDTPAIQVTPFHLPASATPSVPTKSAATNQGLTNPPYSATPAAAKYEPATNTPAKQRNVVRPNLKIQPERKSSTEGPIAVETILKEMTKAVPPDPLTTIQTPRPEETVFTFPAESKEDTSFLKVDPPGIVSPLADPLPNADDQSLPKPDVSSSLQDDLQMSDSDDEVVPEVTVNPEQYLKSPVRDSTPSVPAAVSTSNTTMNDNSDSSNSSSSDNGDSDSDDSSSESNDSDSSSEASDEEISSKKWGLSNFVDESQRIHSPAFIHAERLKNLSLNNMNAINTVPLVKDAVNESANAGTFLVPEVPVSLKSEILSPAPYPPHPTVGPRTPPSPTSPAKQESLSKSENEIDAEQFNSQNKSESDEDISKLSVSRNSPKPDTLVDCDIEEKGSVQNEKCKKQYSIKTKFEESSSELESTSAVDSSLNESSDTKDPESLSEKGNSVAGTEKAVIGESSESSPENYSIKTRQRGTTALLTRKNKPNVDNSSENNQTTETSKPPVSKPKNPRACKKPVEKQKKKAVQNSGFKKPDLTNELKKNINEDLKETLPIVEKAKETPKISKACNIKTIPKVKAKSSKQSPIKPAAIKKPEVKKKKKKFAIENFLQSPENSEKPSSPSPLRSSISGSEGNSPPKPVAEPVTLPVFTSKPNKVNLKTPGKAKKVEKLRRSVRCSERASINAQSDSSVKPQTDSNKKLSGKGKQHAENLPISVKPPVKLLSPIPQDCPLSLQSSDNAIPFKIMVSIQLSMLSRIPSKIKQIQESVAKELPKSVEDENKLQKKDITEKPVKNANIKISQAKDKAKSASSQKNSKTDSKSLSTSKEKLEKTKTESLAKPKIASNVNKNKVKDKTLSDDAENKIPKKRKSEGGEKQNAKKQKLPTRTTEVKKSKELSTSKTDSSTDVVEDGCKSKTLERCDSTGSLSSLCSQQSQRSSKSSKEKKDSMTCLPEPKRIKTSSSPVLSTCAIKQEKVDRPKNASSDKNSSADKSKSKSKLAAKDIIGSEQFWDDSHSSSQSFCHWDDQCKEDPKGKLISMNPSLEDVMNTELTDWDHFAPEMNKDLKETSALNKHNNQAPIMPMDYYFTEGRKQKLLAEKENDPFQQAVKYFEAAVLFILTSQQREEYTKNPESVYQFYNETLKFSIVILSKVKKLQSCPGSTEFKLLILCLKCQSLLNVKLYNLKIKEIKEQLDGINKFLQRNSSTASNPHASTQSHLSRLSSLSNVPSPHSPIPSPASNSQNSSDRNATVSVPQTILDTICLQHSHLINLHRGHDLWEQADMYMTRSNLREFFKEVADQSEPLTLHSSVTELVKYIQKGISLVKKSLR